MSTDLTIILQDQPGTLADMGETLGKAGINIDGVCGIQYPGGASIHILVEDSAGARRALEANGIMVSTEREVLIKVVEDRPGILGEVARSLANAGVNIELVYLAAKNKLVIGVDDLEKARSAI